MAIDKDELKTIELNKLAERIRSLRIKKGYSNYENFAYEHKIPRAQYGRYEKGRFEVQQLSENC